MTKPKARKKPKYVRVGKAWPIDADVNPCGYADIQPVYPEGGAVLGSKDARRLAAWLIKFADWAESKEKP